MDKQSVNNHIKALEEKHREQDKALENAYKRPRTPDWIVNTIKKKKLKLKTEIEHLKQLHNIGN